MNQTGKPPATPSPGSRLKCESCGSEAIIIQPGAAELTCCGAPLLVTFDGSRHA
jgi:hypothetical protein